MLPTKIDRSHKLNDEQKDFVLRKVGCNFTDLQISKLVKEEYEISISSTAVKFYRHAAEYSAKIQKYRAEFEREIIGVELASKRRRVEELNRIYFLNMNAKKKNFNNCMQALSQIQDELEGKGKSETNLTFHHNQYINLTNDEIKQRMYENAKKILELEERKKLNVQTTEEGSQPRQIS